VTRVGERRPALFHATTVMPRFDRGIQGDSETPAGVEWAIILAPPHLTI
jgi:hypothetical protein